MREKDELIVLRMVGFEFELANEFLHEIPELGGAGLHLHGV